MSDHWELLLGLAAIAAAAWSHVRGLVGLLGSIVVVTCQTDDDVASVLLAYLIRDGQNTVRHGRYGASTYMVRPLRRRVMVFYQWLSKGPRLFLDGWRPINYGNVEKTHQGFTHSFSYVRGTVDWELLLVRAVRWFRENTSNQDCNQGHGNCVWTRHRVVYHGGKTLDMSREEEDKPTKMELEWNGTVAARALEWRSDEIGPWKPENPRVLALSPALVEVSAEIRRWFNLKEWYVERGLTWRRGYLFHGEPGTGKTSMARAESEELDLPVHVMDLAPMSNQDLRDAWEEAAKDAPCMILIEDLDGVFNKRTNVTRGGGLMSSGGLSFDALLAVIDGVQQTDGILLVISSNHPDKMDEALLRAGRVDRVVHFPPLGPLERAAIARRILGDVELADAVVAELGDVSGAAVQEYCCRIALARMLEASPMDAAAPPELRREVPKK